MSNYIFCGTSFDMKHKAVNEALYLFVTANGQNDLQDSLESLQGEKLAETLDEAFEADWFDSIDDEQAVSRDDVEIEVKAVIATLEADIAEAAE